MFGSEILYEYVLIYIYLLQNKILNATNFRKQTAESFLQIITRFLTLPSHHLLPTTYTLVEFFEGWVGWFWHFVGFFCFGLFFACLVGFGLFAGHGGGSGVGLGFFSRIEHSSITLLKPSKLSWREDAVSKLSETLGKPER